MPVVCTCGACTCVKPAFGHSKVRSCRTSISHWLAGSDVQRCSAMATDVASTDRSPLHVSRLACDAAAAAQSHGWRVVLTCLHVHIHWFIGFTSAADFFCFDVSRIKFNINQVYVENGETVRVLTLVFILTTIKH